MPLLSTLPVPRPILPRRETNRSPKDTRKGTLIKVANGVGDLGDRDIGCPQHLGRGVDAPLGDEPAGGDSEDGTKAAVELEGGEARDRRQFFHSKL